MDELKTALKSLSKIEPENGFINASKSRLMQQINSAKQTDWLENTLMSAARVKPGVHFVRQAKARLMHRIKYVPQAKRVPLHRLIYSLNFLKKAVASSLVMLLAVTSTLFVVEGNTTVEASDDSYLEVLYGTVSIKHADLIVWEKVNGQIEIQEGDVIRVKSGSEAVIHFFDDSQLRLNEGSTMLISQLLASPAYQGQAMIEVSLHEGQGWVQTMNVEDGYANLVVTTRDAALNALNATFNVSVEEKDETTVGVHTGKVRVDTVNSETREVLTQNKLGAQELGTIYKRPNRDPIFASKALSEQEKATAWVQGNLLRDREHLKNLRERGYDRLSLVAGTLPGQMLYPIKQAKERMKLAFSGENEEMAVKIEIANNRLNEAIVLLEKGEVVKGREALIAYQALAREVIEARESEDVAHQLITPHKKTLNAEVPNNAASGLVKETLSKTAEILAENPLELEKIRLNNSITRLQDIMELVQSGETDAAKERLTDYQLSQSEVLLALESVEDGELKDEALKDVLELREEEFALLEMTAAQIELMASAEDDLIAMVATASEDADKKLQETLAIVAPLLPTEPEVVEVREPTKEELKAIEIADKVKIYNTFNGQKNQIERLLKNELKNPSALGELELIRAQLDGRAQSYLSGRMLQLKNLEEARKHKAMERKIERSQRLRGQE